jgi:LytS/YehU family sensor histidine kinase
MIARLSDFLRTLLRDAERQEVTLAEELELAGRYLDIQRMRYGERLRSQASVHGDAGAARVPMLILQPLVENAVKHGIDRLAHGGAIEIEARRDAEGLQVSVRNDGPPLPQPASAAPASVGLANVRARLRTLYGERASLELRNAEAGGVRAILRLPWLEAHGA